MEIVTDYDEDDLAMEIMVVASSIFSIDMPFMAMTILSRSVDRHRIMRAAGIDFWHNFKITLLLSSSFASTRPRERSVLLIFSTISMDVPNKLEEVSNSIGAETDE